MKGVLKICSKFTGERPCRSVISIKLICNFIEITVWHEYCPENNLRICRAPFYQNSSGEVFLYMFANLNNRVSQIYLGTLSI